MERVVDVVLHLPSRLRELYLAMWWGPDLNASADPSGETFEIDWAIYWRDSQDQDQPKEEGHVCSHSSSGGDHSRSGDGIYEYGQGAHTPVPTARSLLENMSTMTQLTRFSLSDSTETHPAWIVLEIVRHCPCLNSFRPPILSGEGMGLLAHAIQERPGRLEHLERVDVSALARTRSGVWADTLERNKGKLQRDRRKREMLMILCLRTMTRFFFIFFIPLDMNIFIMTTLIKRVSIIWYMYES